MNYLIVISVDNTIEANYRIMLLKNNYRSVSLFADFVFNINRKTTNFLKNNNSIPKASFVRGKQSYSFSFSFKKEALGMKLKL